MPLDNITPDTVRDALRALRYDHPLHASPLVDLDLVTLSLHAEGLADTRQSRSWALGRCLTAAVEEPLARMRATSGGVSAATHGTAATAASAAPSSTPSATPPAALSSEQELERLAGDLRSGSAQRLAWSLLHWRYISPTHQSAATVSRALGVSERTLRNRVAQGLSLLVSELRSRAVAATRNLEAGTAGTPVERILVDEDAAPRSPVELLGELQALVSQNRPSLRLSSAQMAEIAHYPASEMVAYRLGRIAEWSLPRYRLDRRFVKMSLLVDLGEESQAGRWRAREERFNDLRDVLSAVPEPAVVLLGPPGSGKSTLLRRLELDVSTAALQGDPADPPPPIPFLISLNQYRAPVPDEQPPDPRSWLADRWAARFPKLDPLEDALAAGNVLLLLDGLNEIPHRDFDEYQERVLAWKHFLHQTIAGVPGNRAVIACRSLDYSAPLSTSAMRIPQVRLEPLADDKVQDFLHRYSPSDAPELWRRLQGSEMLSVMRWPFFLRLLVEESAEDGGASIDLAGLLTSYILRALRREMLRDNPWLRSGVLIDERDRLASALNPSRSRSSGTPYELPKRGMLFSRLSELAFDMQRRACPTESYQVRVGYADAMAILDCPEAEAVIKVATQLGILDEDRDADEVMFQHQLLQEYFAARALAERPGPELARSEWRAANVSPTLEEVIDALGPHSTLPGMPQTGWEESTLMAAAMTRDTVAFIRGLFDTNLVLAGRAAARPELRSRVSNVLIDTIRLALVDRSRDPKADLRERIAAGHVLGDLGDPRFERREGPFGPYLWPPLADIPGGTYPIGDDQPFTWIDGATGRRRTNARHVPRHAVEVADFRIARFPLTNAEWACFMASGGYDDERWWDTPDALRWVRGELANEAGKWNNRFFRQLMLSDPTILETQSALARLPEADVDRWRAWLALDDDAFEAVLDEFWRPTRRTEPTGWGKDMFSPPSQPVVGICWYEARAYCAWLSAQSGHAVRLPSEAEWEAAARGSAARTFAWGDEFDRTHANTGATCVRWLTPIGAFPGGDTPEGVADMTGNVLEWTSSLLGRRRTVALDAEDGDVDRDGADADFPYPYAADDGREDASAPPIVRRVQRGGWFLSTADFARAAVRAEATPEWDCNFAGMRLVIGMEQPPSEVAALPDDAELSDESP